MKAYAFGIAMVALALALAGCGRSGDETLARVEGTTITTDEYLEYIETRPTIRVTLEGMTQAQAQQILNQLASGGTAELRVAGGTIGLQAAQDLITRETLMQLAAAAGVKPNEEQIVNEIEFRKSLNPNFVQNLQAIGMSMGQIKESIAFDLAREGLLTKGIDVPMDRVEQLIEANPPIQPAQVDLRWIYLRNGIVRGMTQAERKAAVESELNSGASFTAVAIKYSDDANAIARDARYSGGFGAENLFTQDLVDATQVGTFIVTDDSPDGWFADANGIAKFYMESKTEGGPIEMTDARKENLQRQLAMQQGNNAKDLARRILEIIKSATVEVERDSVKDGWDAYLEELRAQDDLLRSTTTPMDDGGDQPAPEGE